MEKNENVLYYDTIAKDYDKSRFANSYGDFIHRQEITFFDTFIGKEELENHLDLGCGTGRFLDYANHGIDPSDKMLAVAKEKHPEKELQVASGTATRYENERFEKIYSFHVMMHLDKEVIQGIIKESHRILKTGGQLIFDFPSQKRRKLIHYKAANWHGATSLDLADMEKLAGNLFTIMYSQGFLFLPIHKFPVSTRKWFYGIDQLLCRSFLKSYSSYIAVILEKK
ncbi:3-demethylubiquinone-9 3-methyltransferase [Nonlabens dokdonensis DSW-6]|uniref:3-demethylubiquinone-9 3-methyltransferase n=2 Tax=Nonlabens dokdonensis TaxID=328515 RepID=L7W6T4_NONDD|nr:3-demethylubiquinone-9 3-methyltransferase [Nonlabens dokdonensis DSW-6]